MQIDVTAVVIAVLGLVFTYVIRPWLKEKKNAEIVETIIRVSQIVVRAAWELDATGELAHMGLSKVDYARTQAKHALESKGIKINDDELKAYIKGAVAELRIDRGDDVKT